MGWAGGSSIMNGIIDALMTEQIDEETRYNVYRKVIPVIEDGDWDTQDESLGLDPAFDKALRDNDPERYEMRTEEGLW